MTAGTVLATVAYGYGAVVVCAACISAKKGSTRPLALALAPVRYLARELARTAAVLGLWAKLRFRPDCWTLALRLEHSRWNAMTKNARLSKDATARTDGGYLRRKAVRHVAGGAKVKLRIPSGSSPASVRKQLPTIQAHLGQPTGTRIRLQPAGRDDHLWLHIRFAGGAATVPWTPTAGPVRLRDPLRLSVTPYGDDVTLDVRNRIGIFGTSGSGKSCVQRLIGAHVVASVDADLLMIDLKQGLESQHYEGKAGRITTAADAVACVDHLLDTEFPRRAARMLELGTSTWRESSEDPALVVMVDEGNVLVRDFTPAQLDRFFTLAEQGRALGVYLVWATQFPKATNLPTALRSQLNIRICLQLISSEEAAVVFKDEVANGWAPHTLVGSGALLIKSAAHRSPEESQALWLDEDVFRTVQPGRPVAPALPPASAPLALEAVPAQQLALSAPQKAAEPVRTQLERDVLALLSDPAMPPLSANAIAVKTAHSPTATRRALERLATQGAVGQTDGGLWWIAPAFNSPEGNGS
jgi:hypothetical protein